MDLSGGHLLAIMSTQDTPTDAIAWDVAYPPSFLKCAGSVGWRMAPSDCCADAFAASSEAPPRPPIHIFDTIAPTSLPIGPPGTPMAATPEVGKSRYLAASQVTAADRKSVV